MYDKALKDCAKQIQALSLREEMEPEHLQTIIYQKRYQQMLARQISGVIRALDTQQYDTVLEFLQDSYVNGYAGVMFDIHGQGIPITVPIDQARTHRAITNDTKLSDNLYKSLQGGTARMKRRVQAEVSRGIASGKTWYQISEKLAKGISGMDNPAYYAQRIARTEGHRIQQEAAYTAQQEAKKAGADVVKQWDATLDDRTREDHRILDGTLAEVDEEFTVSGHKALYPGGFGVPSEDIHCRCAILQRAKWALDEDELERLRQRASYYDLDKTDSFQAFKDKYLQLPEDAVTEPRISSPSLEACTTAKEVEDLYKSRAEWGYETTINGKLFKSMDGASFAGCDLESAKEVYKSQELLFDKYPWLKGQLNTITTDRLPKNIYAQCHVGLGHGGVVLNTLFFGDYNKLDSALMKDIDAGFHPPCASDRRTQLIVLHEFGHAVDDLLSYSYKMAGTTPAGKVKRVSAYLRPKVMKACGLSVSYTDIKENVSEYATEKSAEWFAECFCEYTLRGEDARPVAKELGRQLEEMMAKAQEGGAA